MESVGASLTGVTEIWTWMALSEAKVPSHALTVNALSVPLALASGVQTRLWPEDRTVPVVTGTPPLVRVPLVTESMRKDTVSPLSASASSAAAAKASKVMV